MSSPARANEAFPSSFRVSIDDELQHCSETTFEDLRRHPTSIIMTRGDWRASRLEWCQRQAIRIYGHRFLAWLSTHSHFLYQLFERKHRTACVAKAEAVERRLSSMDAHYVVVYYLGSGVNAASCLFLGYMSWPVWKELVPTSSWYQLYR